VYTPESSLTASGFIAEFIPDDETVHKSYIGGYKTGIGSWGETSPKINTISRIRETRSGYVYVSEADTVSGTMTTDFNGFVYYDYAAVPEYSQRNKIYTSQKDTIFS
jgi:hypothetical protein